jgi:hypothetical protein
LLTFPFIALTYHFINKQFHQLAVSTIRHFVYLAPFYS